MRRHVMPDVDHGRIRADVQNDALQRAGVVVPSSEIREQCDGWTRHTSILQRGNGYVRVVGLRKSISRSLLFMRNESVTRSSLNNLMMSPLSRLRWRGRDAG